MVEDALGIREGTLGIQHLHNHIQLTIQQETARTVRASETTPTAGALGHEFLQYLDP